MIKVPERYVQHLIEVDPPTKRISAQPREHYHVGPQEFLRAEGD